MSSIIRSNVNGDKRATIFLFAVWLLIGCVAAIVAVRTNLRITTTRDLAQIPFLTGPTARSLLEHHDLRVMAFTGTPGNEVLYHSARMPMASLFVAFGWKLFGENSYFQTTLLKTALALAVLGLSAWLCLSEEQVVSRAKIFRVILLVLPFGIPAFLSDLVSLSFEEAHSFYLLAILVSLVLYATRAFLKQYAWLWSSLLSVLLALLYLTKSSMLPATLVIAAAALYRLPTRRPGVLILSAVLITPLVWGLYQRHVGGRFTTGTSLDALNLHKGNSEPFLLHYPPSEVDNLDRYEAEFNQGMFFTSEWQTSDWHKAAAIQFIKTHPRQTSIAIWRKIVGYFFTLHSYGSGLAKSPVLTFATMLILRLLVWAAIATSFVVLFQRERFAWVGLFFVTLVLACAVPYIVGFAYTRHVSVVVFPASLVLCKLLPLEKWLSPKRYRRYANNRFEKFASESPWQNGS